MKIIFSIGLILATLKAASWVSSPSQVISVKEWEAVFPDCDNWATTKDLFSYPLSFLM